MDTSKTNLSQKLSKIWEAGDFGSFFEKYATRAPLKVKAGDTVFYEGDEPNKLFFVKSGFVKMFRMSPEGRSTVIYLYGPGSLIGVRALTSPDKQLKHTAEAMTDTEIVTIPESTYLKALEENPEYILDLLHLFIDRLNLTERKMEGFILTDATARVASFLYDLAERFGVKTNEKVIIPLPLTHQTISEFVGSFRETVTVAINRLIKDGILEDKRGKIVILDLPKLKTEALI